MVQLILHEDIQLPTLARLGVSVVPEIGHPQAIAALWLKRFNDAISSHQIECILHLLLDDALWRDLLPLTWDIRTFFGIPAIRTLLESRLCQSKLSNIRLSTHKDKQVTVLNSLPALVWVQAFFDFDSAAGPCTGVCRIVPTPSGEWKAHSICTILEEVEGHPFAIGRNRRSMPDQGKWKQTRDEESVVAKTNPRVLIIGGGPAGLNAAARLKHLNVPHLVVERYPRIGDDWRHRYPTLCLHDPVYTNHLAYMPFPSTWPKFSPGLKFADWLESYSIAMDLNVLTSSTVSKIRRDNETDEWIVTISSTEDDSKRILRPKYVILAMGSCVPVVPAFADKNKFEGKVLHSTLYRQASDYPGKKVVVVGACTSGHDIAKDCYEAGLDITMVQQSSTCVFTAESGVKVFLGALWDECGPSVDIADRITASYPYGLAKRTGQMAVKRLKQLDQPLHDALEKVGFKANWGPDDSGYILLSGERRGGFYIDTGASQLIIDGKIKIKRGNIQKFTKDGLIFENGSELKADVIILATGIQQYGKELFGSELAAKLNLKRSTEGEMPWVNCGLKNLYPMAGNLIAHRFYSTQIALHIKAKEEGVYTNMYEHPGL